MDKDKTTADVCRELRIERPFLQALIRRIGVSPRQEIQGGNKVNFYSPGQFAILRAVLRRGEAIRK